MVHREKSMCKMVLDFLLESINSSIHNRPVHPRRDTLQYISKASIHLMPFVPSVSIYNLDKWFFYCSGWYSWLHCTPYPPPPPLRHRPIFLKWKSLINQCFFFERKLISQCSACFLITADFIKCLDIQIKFTWGVSVGNK